MHHGWSLIPLFLSLLLSSAFAEETRIGSIDGGDKVEVVHQDETRQASSGDLLKTGDKVLTHQKQTVSVINPDGSVLIVGRGTAVEVQRSEDAPAALEVHSGTVRAIVGKANASGTGKPRKFRLFIRTKTMVLGVRGTDFVVTADAGTQSSRLHTLEGTVEAAKTETDLVSHGGTPVHGGETVAATPERISEPQVFDPARFAIEMKETQPNLDIPAELGASPAPSPSASPSPNPSPTPGPALDGPEDTRTTLKSFQFHVARVNFGDLQGTGGMGVSWNPTLTFLGEWLGLRGTLGYFHAGTTVDIPEGVHGFEAGLALSLRILGHLLLEPGISGQFWSQQTVGGPSLTAGWHFQNRLFGLIDRFYAKALIIGRPRFFENLPAEQTGTNCLSNTCGGGGMRGDQITLFSAGVGCRF